MVWLGGTPISPPPSEDAQEVAPDVAQEAAQGPINCAKCNQQMQEGALQAHYLLNNDLYFSDATGSVEWVETRRRTLSDWLLRRNKKQTLAVKTYRCPSCGYLESYAK